METSPPGLETPAHADDSAPAGPTIHQWWLVVAKPTVSPQQSTRGWGADESATSVGALVPMSVHSKRTSRGLLAVSTHSGWGGRMHQGRVRVRVRDAPTDLSLCLLAHRASPGGRGGRSDGHTPRHRDTGPRGRRAAPSPPRGWGNGVAPGPERGLSVPSALDPRKGRDQAQEAQPRGQRKDRRAPAASVTGVTYSGTTSLSLQADNDPSLP